MRVRLVYPCDARRAPRLGDKLYPPGINEQSNSGHLGEVVGVRIPGLGAQIVDVLLEFGDSGDTLIMLGDEAVHGPDPGDPREGPT